MFGPRRRLGRAESLVATIGVFLAAAVPNVSLPGQTLGTIAGTVVDSARIPLISVEIAVDWTTLRTESNEKGQFRIAGIPFGTAVLRARRLGFMPAQARVEVSEAGPATVSLRLTPVAAMLEPVVVRADKMNYTGRLAGYYRRLERKSSGVFITREQIDRENPRMLKQLLRNVPGISEIRGRGTSSGIRMRGRMCWPLVWMDGIPMPAGEVDLDSFPPSTIQGIEIYLGSTTAPARYTYTRDASSCGTILIWSRGPDTDPINPPPAVVSELERLVAGSSVFTPDQVDRQAVLDERQPLELGFPPPLYATGTSGLVIAEFVVDTLGRVEPETIGIVSSTHPLFTAAVRSALDRATYIPAVKHGQSVRQIVQQPFDFVVNRQAKNQQ
jgi:TonB family protein